MYAGTNTEEKQEAPAIDSYVAKDIATLERALRDLDLRYGYNIGMLFEMLECQYSKQQLELDPSRARLIGEDLGALRRILVSRQ